MDDLPLGLQLRFPEHGDGPTMCPPGFMLQNLMTWVIPGPPGLVVSMSTWLPWPKSDKVVARTGPFGPARSSDHQMLWKTLSQSLFHFYWVADVE